VPHRPIRPAGHTLCGPHQAPRRLLHSPSDSLRVSLHGALPVSSRAVPCASALAAAVVLLVMAIAFCAAPAHADEGMWPPYMLDKLPIDSLRARGLELTPAQLYDPGKGGLTDAVIQVGATASFVSPQGLIVTNHHVAYGAVQEQSTEAHNYLRDGFYAPTKADELEAIGYTVNVTRAVEDVTSEVLGGLSDKTTGIARFEAIDKAIKKVVAETEKGTHLRCRVVAMFGGTQYMKYTFFEIRDVRIVYVPPEEIGNYGGEVDNWMWPRHTGDFAFMRAYVAPDGKPADYSKENVPYHPSVYLPMSAKGIEDGDLTITVGFPGRTSRYISSFDLANQIDFTFPMMIKNSEEQVRIIEEIGRTDPAIELRMANDLKGIYNRLKKNRGIVEGFKRTRSLERKRAEEKALADFIAKDPKLEEKYGSVLPAMQKLYEGRRATQVVDSRLGRLGRSSDWYSLASELYRWAVEREKPDMKRDAGYQERDSASARRGQRTSQINMVEVADRALFKAALIGLLDLPADQKIAGLETLFAGKTGPARDAAVDAYVNDLYARTQVGNVDARLRMFDMTRRELEGLNDPFIQFAALLYPDIEKMRLRDREFEGAENLLAPKLVQAYEAWRDGSMYPDANGTMRLSFGEVRGFHPRDAVDYHYHTLLRGVIEKDAPDYPFAVPEELEAAYAKHDFGAYAQRGDDDIPVDFLTTNDITNGNSGSPVVNGKGELIGLAFDGNYEAVASDYMFDAEMNRTISVDVRYILFLIDKVYHLDALRNELTVR
jgi:hypothetical protein